MVPAKEICATVTMEYYQAVRCAFMSRQIFNVPDYICQQFYNRYISYTANDLKYRLERKAEMHKRGIRSPNDSDATSYLVEICRVMGGFKYSIPKGDGYTPAYGPEYDEKQKRVIADRRMDIMSSILNLNLNFSGAKRNYSGTSL